MEMSKDLQTSHITPFLKSPMENRVPREITDVTKPLKILFVNLYS